MFFWRFHIPPKNKSVSLTGNEFTIFIQGEKINRCFLGRFQGNVVTEKYEIYAWISVNFYSLDFYFDFSQFWKIIDWEEHDLLRNNITSSWLNTIVISLRRIKCFVRPCTKTNIGYQTTYFISFNIAISGLNRRWQPLYKHSRLSMFIYDNILWWIRGNWFSSSNFQRTTTLRAYISVKGFDTDLVPGVTIEVANGMWFHMVLGGMTLDQDSVWLTCCHVL